MCSGLTSVAAASRTFAGYFAELVRLPALLVALQFVLVLSAINYRGPRADDLSLLGVVSCTYLASPWTGWDVPRYWTQAHCSRSA
jgi:hypothetical protein